MRDSMPVILFGLLIAFLVMIVFEWGMDYLGLRTGRGDVIGSINGKKITYREFSELLKNYTDMQRKQDGSELSEAQLKQARDQVWQTILTQYLVEDEVKRLGIKVSDQELVTWVHGDNPPENLRRLFIDSTGQFNRNLYEQFLRNPNQFLRDPEGSDQNYGTRWLAKFETSLRTQKQSEKLQSLMIASVRVTDGEVRQRFMEQKQTFSAAYCLFDANALVKDEEVALTDADMKEYYQDNLDQYRVEATRKVKYVLLAEKPSAADSSMQWKEIEDVAAKARSGANFVDLVYTYSVKPDSGAFFRHGETSQEIEDSVFGAKQGSIVGPVLDRDGLHVMKVLEDRKSDKEYVRASHVLFSLNPTDDTVATRKTVDSVARALRQGASFPELATKYSKDAGSAQRGGDLGWFTRGRMTPAFEKAAFAAKPGEIVGPVRTPFGLHLIKVRARDARELKLAHVSLKIEASPQTKNELFERARDFAYNARETEFTKEAEQTGLQAREVQVQQKGGVIPGLGIDEAISRWIFNAKVGTVSEPFTVTAGYAVVAVIEAKDAGVRPFDEVKEMVKPMALRKKKIARVMQMASDLRMKLEPSDSLKKVQEFNPAVTMRETGNFTLSSSVPGLGRDPSFLGAVAGIEVGAISKPVESTRGAYVIQLLSRSSFDSTAYASQKETLKTRLLQERRSTFLAQWLEQLKQNADIEDHRDLYYR
jgi:parvulin-like peptidyl-prolyl isomerase